MSNTADGGWIKLHRKLLESDMWHSLTATQRDVMIVCLLKANHKERQWQYNGKVHTCKPGQFKTSIESIRQSCARGTTTKQVRGAMEKLRKWQFWAIEGASDGSVVTIYNWETYQKEGQTEGQTVGHSRGKRRATNKNVKNEKKKRKERKPDQITEFVSLTVEEKNKLVAKYGETNTQRIIEKLDAYKGSTGKKYKDDYRAILNWVADEVLNGKHSKPQRTYL